MIHRPLILTLTLDEECYSFFEGLRQKHFPPHLNFLSAHLTLFHHLPGDKVEEIAEHLDRVAASQAPMQLLVGEAKFMGKGVAFPVTGNELLKLHKGLLQHWRAWLTPQDSQGLWPHVTVQNKVSPDTARELQTTLITSSHLPKSATGMGLKLWEYLGGPWEMRLEWNFS